VSREGGWGEVFDARAGPTPDQILPLLPFVGLRHRCRRYAAAAVTGIIWNDVKAREFELSEPSDFAVLKND
jgi:hypothetical protein